MTSVKEIFAVEYVVPLLENQVLFAKQTTEPTSLSQLIVGRLFEYGACRWWTGDHRLQGGKGSMILYGSWMVGCREDNTVLLRNGGMAHSWRCCQQHSANTIGTTPSMSWDRKSHRGSGVQSDKVDFWTTRLRYMVPCHLARPSFWMARGFWTKVPPIWSWPEICIDSISVFKGMAEMLLAAYSAVELESGCRMKPSGHLSMCHQIFDGP